MAEIDEKDEKLRELEAELERRQRQREQNANVLDQTISEVTQRLQQERTLKVDAFRQVERLHQQLEEFDELILSPSRLSTAKSRVRSAVR